MNDEIFISNGLENTNSVIMSVQSQHQGRTALRIIGLVLIAIAIAGIIYYASQSAQKVLNPHQSTYTVSVAAALPEIMSTINQAKASPNTHVVIIPFKAGIDDYYSPTGFYQPYKITIKPGDTVEWVNEDTVIHTAGSPQAFDSGPIWPAGSSHGDFTFKHTFEKAGTFGYHCDLHPHMVGEVIVK